MISNLIDQLKGKIPFGSKRSNHWPSVRAEHLKKNPTCSVCGGTKKIEVHHIRPFHVDPSLELDESNLVSLCEGQKSINCHLVFGHLGNFKSFNVDVVSNAKSALEKFKNRPKG